MDKNLQNLESIKETVSNIECGSFRFLVLEHKGSPYLQIVFDAEDSNTGELETQYCRKWTLQYVMTDTEIVRTAYKAAEATVIHELQESFKYNDVRLYDPHYNVNELVKFMKENNKQDIR